MSDLLTRKWAKEITGTEFTDEAWEDVEEIIDKTRKAVADERLDRPTVLFHKIIHESKQEISASIKVNGIIPQVASEYKELLPESIRGEPVVWLASKLHSYTDAPIFLIETDGLNPEKLYHVVDNDLDWWVYEGEISTELLALIPDEKQIAEKIKRELDRMNDWDINLTAEGDGLYILPVNWQCLKDKYFGEKPTGKRRGKDEDR